MYIVHENVHLLNIPDFLKAGNYTEYCTDYRVPNNT